jgi:hypothetical protein
MYWQHSDKFTRGDWQLFLIMNCKYYSVDVIGRAGHQSSENDSMNRQCWFLPSFFNQSVDSIGSSPLIFNRSFNNVGSSPSFFNRSFNNVSSCPSFLTDIHQCRFQPLISMSVPTLPPTLHCFYLYAYCYMLCGVTTKGRG